MSQNYIAPNLISPCEKKDLSSPLHKCRKGVSGLLTLTCAAEIFFFCLICELTEMLEMLYICQNKLVLCSYTDVCQILFLHKLLVIYRQTRRVGAV